MHQKHTIYSHHQHNNTPHMKHGFVRVGAGIPEIKVGDPQFNVEEIEKLVLKAQSQGIEILVTPYFFKTSNTLGV